MSVLIVFIQKAIVQGICILYGALGEIMTEKSGNLNLGIPGIMYMGGIAGLMGAFLYEKDNPDPNAFMGVLISFCVCICMCCDRWSDLQYPDYHTSCKSECNRSCTYHFWYRFW